MPKLKKRLISDAIEILDRRLIRGKPEMEALMEEVDFEHALALELFALRKKAGLSEKQLAKCAGTTASVIDGIEHTDFEDVPLPLLWRIAAALGKRLEVRFVNGKRKRQTA